MPQPEPPAHASPGGRWQVPVTRRQVLVRAGGGLAALVMAGVAGYEWPHGLPKLVRTPGAAPPNPLDATGLLFVSRPDLRPPQVRVSLRSGAAATPPYIFLAARTYLSAEQSQSGLMVIDRRGHLVWFKPLASTSPFDLQVQAYRGRPVLTWWQGQVVNGYGEGVGEMAGASYRTIARIGAVHRLQADLHELQLTSAGTALITAYQEVEADLSAAGGAAKGKLLTGHVQEVDVATGRALMDWDSLDHVGLEESYETVPKNGPYDYFHINSIAEAPDGNLIISARNTWAVYKVDRSTGKVIWRMNGKRSGFTMGPGAPFFWQHDARPHGTGVLTVFDDGATPPEERRSRGLLLMVDEAIRHVSLRRAYLHPAGFLAANQGNVQLLPDGRVFVGWGNQPYFSEFSPSGELTLDGEMPIGYHSYRAYTQDWSATPDELPAAVVKADPAGGSTVYASWNGATAVDSWKVLSGPAASSLEVVGGQERTGFETEIAVNTSGHYFAVVALDSAGRQVGRSSPVTAGR